MQSVESRLSEIRQSANDIERYVWHTIDSDEMEPTLKDGDLVVADVSQDRYRHPGLYLVRSPEVMGESCLWVRRLDGASSLYLNVILDNRKYESFTHVPVDKVEVVGRVIVTARAYP